MAINDIKMPVMDRAAAERAEAANAIALQQQLKGNQAGTGQAVAGAMAAQQTQAQGQVSAQAAAAESQRVVQQQQMMLEQQKMAQQEQDIIEQETFENKRIQQQSQLSGLGRDVKEKIVDDRLKFDKSSGEARFTNQRQLADFMISQQADQERFADYQQTVTNAAEMDIQLMQQAYRVFEQKERQMVQSGEAEKDRASLERIRAKKAWLAEQERKARKKASSNRKMIGAAKIVVGTTVAVVGGPVGVGVGSSMAVQGASEVAAEG